MGAAADSHRALLTMAIRAPSEQIIYRQCMVPVEDCKGHGYMAYHGPGPTAAIKFNLKVYDELCTKRNSTIQVKCNTIIGWASVRLVSSVFRSHMARFDTSRNVTTCFHRILPSLWKCYEDVDIICTGGDGGVVTFSQRWTPLSYRVFFSLVPPSKVVWKT